jgi:hypothetical protein
VIDAQSEAEQTGQDFFDREFNDVDSLAGARAFTAEKVCNSGYWCWEKGFDSPCGCLNRN